MKPIIGKYALVIANGEIPSKGVCLALAKSASYIVCADGGVKHAARLGITPDVVLGDFDSQTDTSRRTFPQVERLHIPDQYSTDLEKALKHCVAKRFKRVEIIGATGGRIDHALGALGCFRRFEQTLSLRIIDKLAVITSVGRKVSFASMNGEKISLIPLDRCTGIVTKGLLYPLRNDSLEQGVRDGISNQATGRRVTITVGRGTLLLYRFYARD